MSGIEKTGWLIIIWGKRVQKRNFFFFKVILLWFLLLDSKRRNNSRIVDSLIATKVKCFIFKNKK